MSWFDCKRFLLTIFLAINSCSRLTHGGEKYEPNQNVVLFVNKVGPYYNPHETYHYYELPVCTPPRIEHKSLTLGEILDGDRMASSLYEIKFRKDVKEKLLCRLKLTPKDVHKLKDTIEDLYYFEFVIDDIPVRGFVGHLEESGFLPHRHKVFLWTHYTFNIEFHNNRIIYASVSTKDSSPVNLGDYENGGEIPFTYSVNWIPSTLKYSERGRRIREDHFFPKTLEIHWLSIINSLVLVFLLIGFVCVILTRILKKDFARYNLDDEEGDEDDNGWKIIHSDVFRTPYHKALFASILGVGSQFLLIGGGILLMAMLGLFNVHKHGAINTAAILLYAMTSGIAGYISATMFKKIGGENWVRNVNLTSFLFAAPFFIIWAFVNTVAWGYGTTQALPWTTVVLLMLTWLVIGYPLTIVGGVMGKNLNISGLDAPCRTKNIPREIPAIPWYKSAPVQCLIGGFLPFSAISVELYYIYATVWSRQHYTLYGILFVVYFILLSVTACVSIALTYFQLAAEDHRWWWRSIMSAGSTGAFVFLYSLFYYYKRSNMTGAMQTVEYFGYCLLICYISFLSLGTVGFFASLKFVRYIYVSVKMD